MTFSHRLICCLAFVLAMPLSTVNPYVAAGKFKLFSGESELVPGIRATASHGHTVGHT
jgi:hypothetical protein